MTASEREHDREVLPFFRSPPAWVLLRQGPGGLQVVKEGTDQGRAILCFLSLLDAMIEVERAAQLGGVMRILPASDLDGSLFRDADGRGLIATLHAGWLAFGSRILVRRSGALGRYTTGLHVWAGDPVFFEVQPETLDTFNQLYEAAGLFAWRETHHVLRGWDGGRLRETARKALEAIQTTGGGPDDCTGIALFDPEFVQWHFVQPVAGNHTL